MIHFDGDKRVKKTFDCTYKEVGKAPNLSFAQRCHLSEDVGLDHIEKKWRPDWKQDRQATFGTLEGCGVVHKTLRPRPAKGEKPPVGRGSKSSSSSTQYGWLVSTIRTY